MAFRKGQWVTLAVAIDVVAAIIDGEPIVKTLPAGTLGIHHPLDGDRQYQHEAGAPMKGAAFTGRTGFHQVDPKDGFETLRCVAVDPAVLTPVTSRDQIPAARLATMSPDWTPRA